MTANETAYYFLYLGNVPVPQGPFTIRGKIYSGAFQTEHPCIFYARVIKEHSFVYPS